MEGAEVTKKIRCGGCIYRAAETSGYLCDYAAITGHTRMAVPITECRHFQAGSPIAQMNRVGWNGEVKPILQDRKARKRGRPRYDWGIARELYEQGLNDHQIAARLGCRHGAVFEWRKREGLEANYKPPVVGA